MPITSEPTPNPPPDGTAHVSWMGVNGDSSWATGAWLLISGTPGGTDRSDLATDLYGTFETNILGHLGTGCTLTECKVEFFESGGSIVAETFATHSGSASDAALPANVAVVLSWQILTTYRGGKPRNYIPGVNIGALISRRLYSDSYVSTMSGAARDWLDDVNALTAGGITAVSMGTVHFFSGGVALSPPWFDPYLGVAAQKRVCTQRRRLGREL